MPNFFDSLIGNTHIKEDISAMLRSGFPNAILISAPKNSGKSTLSRIISAGLVCENKDNPCSVCNNCIKANLDISPDIITMDFALEGISQMKEMRNIISSSFIAPNDSLRKVYILKNIQNLSIMAQNALLKTLEEPPNNCYFILLSTNKSACLPTLNSRLIHFSLSPLGHTEQIKYIAPMFAKKNPAEIDIAIKNSGGFLGNTIDILKQEPCVNLSEFIGAISIRNEFLILKSLSPYFSKNKVDVASFINMSVICIRDALFLDYGNIQPLGIGAYREIKSLSENVKKDKLINIYLLLCKTYEDCKLNLNMHTLLNSLSVRLFRILEE